jgi:hypothetical protein
MIEKISEYDLRQFNLMVNIIREYEDGPRSLQSLGRLVSALQALQSALENASGSFDQKFRASWGEIETTYALMLDEERTSPNKVDESLIDDAIVKLKALLSSRMRSGRMPEQ